MGVDAVVARRRRERRELIDRARRWASSLDLEVRAAVVFGSVARGDFNLWSDVDVLLVTPDVSGSPLDRAVRLGARPPRVQPLAWTPGEARQELARRNPIAEEAVAAGVWLIGSPEAAFGAAALVTAAR
jgi:uncharacterized protein